MNTTLKYGILGGVILAVTVVFYSLDVENKVFYSIWSIFQVIVIAMVIYLGVKEEKKLKHNNSISYRDAIFTALKINFLAAVIHSASLFIYFNFNPNVLNRLVQSSIDQAVTQMKDFNFKEAAIQDHIKFIQKDITPYNLAKNNFLIILILGLVISLIVTAILRTKDTTKVPEIDRS